MENNALCSIIGCTGLAIASFCFVCYFFGMAFGLWGTFIGIAMMGLSLVSYD